MSHSKSSSQHRHLLLNKSSTLPTVNSTSPLDHFIHRLILSYCHTHGFNSSAQRLQSEFLNVDLTPHKFTPNDSLCLAAIFTDYLQLRSSTLSNTQCLASLEELKKIRHTFSTSTTTQTIDSNQNSTDHAQSNTNQSHTTLMSTTAAHISHSVESESVLSEDDFHISGFELCLDESGFESLLQNQKFTQLLADRINAENSLWNSEQIQHSNSINVSQSTVPSNSSTHKPGTFLTDDQVQKMCQLLLEDPEAAQPIDSAFLVQPIPQTTIANNSTDNSDDGQRTSIQLSRSQSLDTTVKSNPLKRTISQLTPIKPTVISRDQLRAKSAHLQPLTSFLTKFTDLNQLVDNIYSAHKS